jgi:uncharacterized protein
MSSTLPAPQPMSGAASADHPTGRARTIGSRADVATGAPVRYAKQLVAHLGRKVPFTGDAITVPATAVIGSATAGIVVGDGVVTLLVTGDDGESVARVEQVLGGHLQRFAQREALTVRWVRSDGAAIATPGAFPTSSASSIEESA